MSAAEHPVRGALSLAGGLLLLTSGVVAVPLLVAGGTASTLLGAGLGWGVAIHLARKRRAFVVPPRWEVRS